MNEWIRIMPLILILVINESKKAWKKEASIQTEIISVEKKV